MLGRLLKRLNPEIVIGFLIATCFWIGVFGWQATYTSTEIEKQSCQQAAQKEGHNAEDCKSLWEKTTTDPVAFFTLWLVVFTGGLTVSTVALWRAGEKQIEFLRESSESQSRDMQASIAEALRGATAMENVAQGIDLSAKATQTNIEIVRERSAMQMRAYIAVVIGAAVYQERDKKVRFEGKSVMVNTGHTPAHNVRYWATARIADLPIKNDFDYEIGLNELGGAPLNPNQTFILSAVVPDYVDDAEIENIKKGIGKALIIWGAVKYRDAFGEDRQTRFAQTLTWMPNGNIYGYFHANHNDAD